MDFKIQKVSIVKAPPVLPGTSNSQRKLNNKEYHSHSKEGHTKPPLPGGKPHGVHLERNTAGSGATSSTDHNQNKDRNQREYCYAGVEFRPLHVTDEEAVSIAIVPPNNDSSSRAADKQKREILPYQEVQIPSGDFDKINTESILIKTSQTSTSTNNSALAAFTADIQDMTHAYYDDNWDSQQASSSRSSGKKPPPMPKPYSKTKDSVDGPSTGKKRIPPPMPKPYNSRKEEVEKPNPPEGELIQDAVYAVVDKSSKQRHPTRAKDDMADEVEDNEPPPPLPSRPDFEAQEDLKRSQEDMANQDLPEVAEKSAKGMGILKTIKKHIRQASDGSGSSRNEELKQKSASTEELTKPDDSAAKPVRAYLVTDIVNQPSTKMFGEPEMYETASDVRDEEDSHSSSNDLPEGWQEVKDSGDTYYWHVASGTTQWQKPRKLETTPNNSSHRPNVEQPKPKHKPELKTVTSFPVHSMGWMELEESQVAPHNMSDTIAECISNLARQRKDLWKTSETWGEGKDLRLLLETDNLKLVDVQTKATLLVQPISKMRVWGAGREELKDFAYVARDQSTGKHKCHVFRCHGSISGRAIHNKLHEMCNKILAEKKKARENQQQNSSSKQWSDILNTPPKPSLKDQAGFNVKPVAESKKSFSAKYIGKVEVPKPSGIDVLHKAINIAINAGDFQKWRTCLIEITVSSVRSTECLSQQIIAEDRIKFVSFIGVAKDVKYCGYITSAEQHPPFICHVFQCIPNAASFTKALEEACRLRLQSCLDTNPELAQKLITVEADKGPGKESKPPVGLKGFLGKLAHQTKLGGKKANAEPVQGNNPLSSDRNRALETTSSASHSLIKYYGHQPVSVGTGPTAIKEAVKTAQGTTLQISILNIGPEGITLDDSIKSGISRKHIPSERISYCGLASDRVHFGVVESQGGGKFICHVFQEYKIPVNTIVEAINRVL